MKILHVISSLGTGGAEKLILDTVPLYNERGIHVDVLLLWNNNYPFTQKLKALNCCTIFILNESSNPRDMYSLSNIPKIRRIIKDYDLIHAHLSSPQYFLALANIGINKKLVFTEHCTSNRRIKNKLFKLVEKWCYNQYDKLVCISDEIKEIYSNYLSLNNRIVVINNGVNLQNIQQAEPVAKTTISPLVHESDKLIIQVSAFRPQKDQDALIKAMAFLPIDFKLILVGDGERRKELERLVQDLSLSSRVIFLGQRMDVARLLKTADFVVLSSHYEGLSLSSIEGMASGNPFIASNVPGLTEIVKNYGVLFPDGNSEKLAEEILRLDEDETYKNDVVKRCMERAKDFDIKTMVGKHFELYEELTTDVLF